MTSGSHSPMLEVGIGLGYVPSAMSAPGDRADRRCTRSPRHGEVAAKPIYRREEWERRPDLPRRPALPPRARLGQHRRRRGDPRRHLVRRRSLGELVHYEPRAWAHRCQGRLLRRGRVGEGRLRPGPAALGRGARGERDVVDAPETVEPRTRTAQGWLIRIRLPSPTRPRLPARRRRLPRSLARVSFLSLTAEDREAMLAAIGVDIVDELFRDIPAGGPVRAPARRAAGALRGRADPPPRGARGEERDRRRLVPRRRDLRPLRARRSSTRCCSAASS